MIGRRLPRLPAFGFCRPAFGRFGCRNLPGWFRGRSELPHPRRTRLFRREGDQHPSLIGDAQAAVQLLAHLNPATGIGSPLPIRRDLQGMPGEGEGVVVAHRALVLEAKHGFRVQLGGPLEVGPFRIGGLLSEAGVKARQVFLQGAVSLFKCGSPCPTQLLDQAVLQGNGSMRPLAWGEEEGMSSIPSSSTSRPNWLLGRSPANSCSSVAFLGLWKMVCRSA